MIAPRVTRPTTKVPAVDATTRSTGALAISSASSTAARIAATTGRICTTCPPRTPPEGAMPTPRMTMAPLSLGSPMRASTR
ncbi:MAG: hypothetical protein MUF10_20620 [Thermoanaerobaculaceae bacterium]|nr:hypothetical protein [Thermoanaerobaculaceae bacterium]